MKAVGVGGRRQRGLNGKTKPLLGVPCIWLPEKQNKNGNRKIEQFFRSHSWLYNMTHWTFPGGTVDETQDSGLIPGLGRFHMPRGN